MTVRAWDARDFGAGEWDLAAGSVHGYRWWDLAFTVGTDGALWHDSPSRFYKQAGPRVNGMYGNTWELRSPLQWAKARCPRENHVPPCDNRRIGITDAGCGCGFWAFWDLTDETYARAAVYVACFGPASDVYMRIAGAAEGAGRTLIGSKGFRCEKMRVHAVAIPPVAEAAAAAWLPVPVFQAAVHKAVKCNLPGTRVYHDTGALLAAHPPTKGYRQ